MGEIQQSFQVSQQMLSVAGTEVQAANSGSNSLLARPGGLAGRDGFVVAALPSFNPHMWTRLEYERMIEEGVFSPTARFELIDGEIITMAPQGSHHATSLQILADYVGRLFGSGFHVRAQLPLALGEYSEPEPDIAVVKGSIHDYRYSHPESAELVVEIANSTLVYDRLKSHLYAKHGIPEYWIVNLKDTILEVFQGLESDHYASRRSYRIGDSFHCLNGQKVHVSEILVP